MELDRDDPQDYPLGDGEPHDPHDPDYEPGDSAARARGNVVRKRKMPKDKRPRSRSRGRRTRSQAAVDKENNEVKVDWIINTNEAQLWCLDNFRQRLGLSVVFKVSSVSHFTNLCINRHYTGSKFQIDGGTIWRFNIIKYFIRICEIKFPTLI